MSSITSSIPRGTDLVFNNSTVWGYVLLETKNLLDRKKKLEEILVTYTNYNFTNKTIQ